MPQPTSDAMLKAALTVGVRRFVVRFATRHRVEGLLPAEAATQALRDMGHEALARILGIPQLAPEARKRPGVGVAGQRAAKRPARRKRRAPVRRTLADPDADRLEKLKRFVGGGG